MGLMRGTKISDDIWSRILLRLLIPVDIFLEGLRGRWDGKNHIEMLADCVPNDNTRWAEWFHTWFLAMVAQWLGLNISHGNSVAPLLISRQGYRKSTFCKRLLPEALQWGYNDNLIISEKQNTLRAMTQSLLINIDEFNTLSAKTQDDFKECYAACKH